MCENSELFAVIRSGNVEKLKALISETGDLKLNNTRDEAGYTPLIIASMYGNPAIVRLLLLNGADPNIQDGNGNTPVSWAAGNNNQEVVDILLKVGANPNTPNRNGYTPLMQTVSNFNHKNNNPEIAKKLLDHGADRNAKSGDETALDIAKRRGYRYDKFAIVINDVKEEETEKIEKLKLKKHKYIVRRIEREAEYLDRATEELKQNKEEKIENKFEEEETRMEMKPLSKEEKIEIINRERKANKQALVKENERLNRIKKEIKQKQDKEKQVEKLRKLRKLLKGLEQKLKGLKERLALQQARKDCDKLFNSKKDLSLSNH